MAVFSKELFYKDGAKHTCKTFHTWSESCLKALLMLMPHGAIGCLQFFWPIYLIQAMLNYKKIEKAYLLSLLKGYLRSTFYGFIYVISYIMSNCFICKITGRAWYYTICLLCGFLCGLPIFIESDQNRNLNALYFFNLLVEAFFTNAQYFGYFKLTKESLTIFFMSCSGLLSYLMKKQKEKPYNNLWFHSPKQYKLKTDKTTGATCVHEESCDLHLIEGFYKYFLGGYAVEIVKFMLTRYGLLVKRPTIVWRMLFSKNNFKFGLVTGGYVALYRMLTCYFTQRDQFEKNHHHLLAGFLSGITFCIKPDLQLACLSFTTLMQLLLQRVQSKTRLSQKWNGVLFAAINGILVHNRFALPETCPKYIIHMFRVCSHGMDRHLLDVINKIIAI